MSIQARPEKDYNSRVHTTTKKLLLALWLSAMVLAPVTMAQTAETQTSVEDTSTKAIDIDNPKPKKKRLLTPRNE